MDIEVEPQPDGTFRLAWMGGGVRCSIGRGGIGRDKREGDGRTPVGCFALRRVLYRPDRLSPPRTALPVHPISAQDGWCDDPAHPDYNRPVTLPFGASHEALWREDGVYDVIVVLGHNDDPPRQGAGSAIFLHVAKPDWEPTAGCVAVELAALLRLLGDCRPGDRLCVAGLGPTFRAGSVQAEPP
jgi:L,D-peptidoglycan transpeptidase YkuD (ErfK/YbiS/YcfS/YnhG family)